MLSKFSMVLWFQVAFVSVIMIATLSSASAEGQDAKKYQFFRSWSADSDVLLSPSALAVDENNQLLVSNRDLGRLTVISQNDRTYKNLDFDSIGFGLALDAEGNIYLSDSGNHRVCKYDKNGDRIFAWGKKGCAKGQFNTPHGVAVDINHNL